MIDPLVALSGLIVGLLVGMTGVGGGSLMTPLLILFFGVSPATAVGTDLIYAAATKTAGTVVHGFAGSIEWRIVGRLATGSIPATAASIYVLSQFDLNGPAASTVITWILCFALFLTAGALIFGEWLVQKNWLRERVLSPKHAGISTILVGAAIGVLVSLSSIGAGAIGVVALVILYPKLHISKIVGSDIAHAVPLALTSGMGHWVIGSVDWKIISSLLLGSIPGIVLGSTVAVRIPERALKFFVACILVVVACRLAYHHASTVSALFTGITNKSG